MNTLCHIKHDVKLCSLLASYNLKYNGPVFPSVLYMFCTAKLNLLDADMEQLLVHLYMN